MPSPIALTLDAGGTFYLDGAPVGRLFVYRQAVLVNLSLPTGNVSAQGANRRTLVAVLRGRGIEVVDETEPRRR